MRIHSAMIYIELIKYINVGDSQVPFMHYFPFISEMKNEDITTTGKNHEISAL